MLEALVGMSSLYAHWLTGGRSGGAGTKAHIIWLGL